MPYEAGVESSVCERRRVELATNRWRVVARTIVETDIIGKERRENIKKVPHCRYP